MTNEELEIARAFVECSPWKWLPGMLTGCGYRLVREDGPLWWVARWDEARLSCISLRDSIPDITDPATLGCIVQLIRDAGGLISKLSILPLGCHLVVEWSDGVIDSFRGTFAACLLQALQAASEVNDG